MSYSSLIIYRIAFYLFFIIFLGNNIFGNNISNTNITVRIKNVDSNTTSSLVNLKIFDFITGENIYYSSYFNPEGYANFQVQNPYIEEAKLEFNSNVYNVLLPSSGKLTIIIDYQNLNFIEFEGENAITNYELLKFNEFINPLRRNQNLKLFKIRKKESPEKYFACLDSSNLVEKRIIEEYLKNNEVSELTKEIINKEFEIINYSALLQYKNNRGLMALRVKDSSLVSVLNLHLWDNIINSKSIINAEKYFLDDLTIYFANYAGVNGIIVGENSNDLGNYSFKKFTKTLDRFDIGSNLKDILATRWFFYAQNSLNKKADFSLLLRYVKSSFVNEHIRQLNNNQNQQVDPSEKDSPELLTQIIKNNRGKVIFMDFWAVWCGHCYKGLKEIDSIRENYKDKNIVFLNLCCESEKQAWQKAILKYGIKGESMFVNTKDFISLQKMFKITSYPLFVIIDQNGNRIGKNIPTDRRRLVSFLDSLLLANNHRPN